MSTPLKLVAKKRTNATNHKRTTRSAPHTEANVDRNDRAEPRVAVDARADRRKYFMGIAMAVRNRANCRGNRVGAIIVLNNRIISTGYNGTPENMPNCLERGCYRCDNRAHRYPSGTGYDLCICVHAEQNALLAAARFGIPVEGSTIYTTLRPCFGCAKELLQANVHTVYFLHRWSPNAGEDTQKTKEQEEQYYKLLLRFPGGVRQVQMRDPLEWWALSKRPPATTASDDLGMQLV
ncbi:MAG: deoxycytidylate deaminase [Chlamydiota bacterium]